MIYLNLLARLESLQIIFKDSYLIKLKKKELKEKLSFTLGNVKREVDI